MNEYAYVVNVDCAVYRENDADEREYLLIRRSEQESHAAGVVAFPGGKLEADPGDREVVAATARREVREETGVTVTDVQYATSTVFTTDDGTRVVNVVCVGRYAGGEARPREPAEVAAVEWRVPAAIREADDVPGYLTASLDAAETTRRGE